MPEKLKKMNSVEGPLTKLRFCKWASPKKQVDPSRQLFETVNFAFMKIFDFLVKIALLEAFLLLSWWFVSKITAEIEFGGYMISAERPQKGCFDKKIKNFHKSKVDGLKKLSTRAHLFYDFLHFRGCPFTKAQFSQGAIDGIHFFQLFWHCHISQKALESKLEIAYFFNITFLRIAIVYCNIRINDSQVLKIICCLTSTFFRILY